MSLPFSAAPSSIPLLARRILEDDEVSRADWFDKRLQQAPEECRKHLEHISLKQSDPDLAIVLVAIFASCHFEGQDDVQHKSAVRLRYVNVLLDFLRDENSYTYPAATCRVIQLALFDAIRACLIFPDPKSTRYGLTIWVKWITLPAEYLPTQDILTGAKSKSSFRYFELLHYALQHVHGHADLQKYALYVLRKSVVRLEHDVETSSFKFEIEQKEQYVAEYNKYCSLFETIVIGRYPNQVEECLNQLPTSVMQPLPLPSSDIVEKSHRSERQVKDKSMGRTEMSVVQGTWWIVLLAAALEQSNSEQVRKVVGTWALENQLPPIGSDQSASSTYAAFLTQSLLPWAMQGQLLTKSIQRDGRRCRSSHGDKLAIFCKNIILSTENDRRKDSYAGNILRYLVQNGHALNPHATGYVLQGIDSAGDWKASLEVARLAVELPNKVGFSQVQRAIVIRHCVSIASRVDSTLIETDIESLEQRLAQLRSLEKTECGPYLYGQEGEHMDVEATIRASSALGEHPGLSSSQTQRTLLDEPTPELQTASSKNTELLSDCERVLTLLNLQDNPEQSETPWSSLNDILQQDPSQAVLVRAAKITFHPRRLRIVFNRAESQAGLAEYITEAANTLFDLSIGKAFIWNPLAEGYRKAIFVYSKILLDPSNEDFLACFINGPPQPKPEYLLDAALATRELDETDNHVFDIFADETYGYACIFDMLNRLQPAGLSWGLHLMDRLLAPWLEQQQPVPMVARWKRTSQLQAIVILLESCGHSINNAKKYWNQLLSLLTLEPHPRYRFLFEWMLISLSRRIADLDRITPHESLGFRNILHQLENPDYSNPKHVASIIKIAVQLALHASGDSPDWSKMEDFNLRLITKLTALSAAPKIAIRHEAQWCFPILFAHAKAKKYTSITSNFALVELDKFIRTLDKYNKPPDSKVFGLFDASKDMNLATLFEGDYLKLDPPEAPLVRVEDFEKVIARDKATPNIDIPPAHLPLGRSTRAPKPASTGDDQQSSAEPHISQTRSTPLQTKSFNIDTSFTSPLDASPTLTSCPAPTGPILIASLLTNAHNLGGLSRVAEIFGCASLHIPDANMLRNPQFKSVSVNSEEHVKIEETGPGGLVAWIRDMKASGGKWTVVGVEQTDTSRVIGMPTGQAALDLGIAPSASGSAGGPEEAGKVLPRKSIIIMGAEKTGIPADVLVECDVCVEIRQWGVIRSLNVQTAAACVLFEWRREWGGG